MNKSKSASFQRKIKKNSPVPVFLPNKENAMSRRYLMLMQRWLPFGMKHFKEWPDMPDCGHFFGGVYWYGLDTAQPLLVLASVVSSPEYSPGVTGFSREHLIKTAIKALRYLCLTHDTGPAECIRPESEIGYKHLQKTKWGERGKGFFPESQCGVTLASMVVAAQLLRKWLDTETCSMLEKICEDYLVRFGTMLPHSGIYNDTQTEENAWTALGLSSALLFLNRHKQEKNWDENARRWMFCTSTAPDDMHNLLAVENGKTVNQLCGKIITTLPDLMAENHGIVHPGYTAAGITLSGMTANIYQLFGLAVPEHLYWHRKEIYENLKYIADKNGFILPPQGMDWPYIFPGRCSLHGYAWLYLNDVDAAAWEDAELSINEKMLDNNQGRMYPDDVTKYCSNVQDPMIMWEARIGASYPWIYMAHRLNTKKQYPHPKSMDVFIERNQGVKVFPHSGFVFHRHNRGQTSFSWRNVIMALPWTRDGILSVAPGFGTLLARIKVKEYPQSRNTVYTDINKHDHGFAALMLHEMFQKSVQQRVLFASLPDGNIVCREILTALKDCTVEKLEQGYLQIMNEKFPGIPSCKGFRKFYHTRGERIFPSIVKENPDEDIFEYLENPEWLNVDDMFGIIFSGNARSVYHNKHYFKPYHAVADELFLNLNEEPRKYLAGEEITSLSFLFCPEQSHEKTPGSTFLRGTADNNETVCFLTDEYLTAGNFGGKGGCFSFKFPRKSLISIVASATTRICRDKIVYQVELNGQQGNYFPVAAFIETNDENIKVTVASSGDIYFTNEGNITVEIKLDGQENITIKNDQTICISKEILKCK